MAIKLSSTAQAVSNGIKILLYGASGSGKTRLSASLPGATIILSAEAGLLSLRDFDIPVAVIESIGDLEEAYDYLTGKEGEQYQNVVLDSLSEIAEQILATEKAEVKDGRMAYAVLGEKVIALTKAFRDLPGKNVVCIAKVERMKDELTGMVMMTPSFPGSKLAANLPYYFDEVFYSRVETNAEGETTFWLQCQSDKSVIAKDRSGALEQYEPADFAAVFGKINAVTHGAETTSAKRRTKGA